MVTLAEAHDVAVAAPWYAPPGRTVAIHRYLEPGFVDLFRTDVSRQPELRTDLFAWEAEDRLSTGQGGVLKLRRPMHRTFHIVAWEASCKIPNAPFSHPAIAPQKIAGAGFVIRSGDPLAPQGFNLVGGKPKGWGAVDPLADPDAARQLKAFGLVPRQATPNPGYTGEETFPLHPLLVQGTDRPHTVLFGYLPIGGAEYLPPATPAPAPDQSNLAEDLPWPFGLADRSNGPPPYTFDQQIIDGSIDSRLTAVLRVLLVRYQFADPAAWSDPNNQPIVTLLNGMSFYTAPPPNPLSAAGLRSWAALNAVPNVTLGSVLRDNATALALLASVIQAPPTAGITLPGATPVPAGGVNLLITEDTATQLRAALRLRLAQAVATSSTGVPVPKLVPGPAGRYFVVPFVRTVRPDGCERIYWGLASAPFAVAGPFDADASRPVLIAMPDFADLKAGAPNGVSLDLPPRLADLVNGLTNSQAVQDMANGKKPGGLGIRFICSFSLPAIMICATLLISIVLSLLNIVFQWMAWVKICLPLPVKK